MTTPRKPRERRHVPWLDRWNRQLQYAMHPGAVLSKYCHWVRQPGEFSDMHGPEPDTINVAIMHTKPVELALEHVYYVLHKSVAPMWVSFGHSDNPAETIKQVGEKWHACWINDRARPLREWNPPGPKDITYASDLPAEHRWRYNQSDYTEYTDK